MGFIIVPNVENVEKCVIGIGILGNLGELGILGNLGAVSGDIIFVPNGANHAMYYWTIYNVLFIWLLGVLSRMERM